MNDIMPIISVIIPVYGAENYLPRCLDSLMNQSLSNIEIILINDGSPDQSPMICEEYSKRDPRFKTFHQENKGISNSRNRGIDLANGMYLMFVDNDDWVEKDYCKFLFNTLISEEVDLVMCGYKIHYRNKVKIESTETSTKYFKSDIIKSFQNQIEDGTNLLGNLVWAKIFRKDIIKNNRIYFNTKLKFADDILFINQYQQHVECFIQLPDILYNYNRINENSVTLNYIPNYYDEIIFVKQKIFELYKDSFKFTEEQWYYQHIRVAAKAVLEEGKLNNGRNLTQRYLKIKKICNKQEILFFSSNFSLPKGKGKLHQLLRRLIYLNQPLLIAIILTFYYKFIVND